MSETTGSNTITSSKSSINPKLLKADARKPLPRKPLKNGETRAPWFVHRWKLVLFAVISAAAVVSGGVAAVVKKSAKIDSDSGGGGSGSDWGRNVSSSTGSVSSSVSSSTSTGTSSNRFETLPPTTSSGSSPQGTTFSSDPTVSTEPPSFQDS